MTRTLSADSYIASSSLIPKMYPSGCSTAAMLASARWFSSCWFSYRRAGPGDVSQQLRPPPSISLPLPLLDASWRPYPFAPDRAAVCVAGSSPATHPLGVVLVHRHLPASPPELEPGRRPALPQGVCPCRAASSAPARQRE